MKINKWQIVGVILLSLSFFFIYSCKSRFNKREVEKALIQHELEKRKDHIINRIKPKVPHPFR